MIAATVYNEDDLPNFTKDDAGKPYEHPPHVREANAHAKMAEFQKLFYQWFSQQYPDLV